MKKTIILSILVSAFSALTANANTPLNWCITELIEVREKVKVLEPEAIEIVDGYTDLDSIEDVQVCEAMLSETEGLLEKACNDRKNLNKIAGFEVYINKASIEACKGTDSEAQLKYDGTIERTKVVNPSMIPSERLGQSETSRATAQ